LKTPFLIFAIATICCTAALAEPFPIIDVRYGYLIGAIDLGKWIEPTDATSSVQPESKLPVYGVTGAVGTIEVLKVDTQNEPCPDRPIVKLRPKKMTKGAIAFAASWKPLPRKPRLVDVKQKEHVDVVREFLRERGLRDPVVHITQIVQIDLDGDGHDEFVISATHYKNADKIPDESSANTYSCVLLEHMVDEKPKAELITGEFYPEAKADATPNKFEIAALLDLNGDGKIDIVIRSTYYAGDDVSVYERQASGFNKRLSVGCGL